jgi:site-specific DNA recombinase
MHYEDRISGELFDDEQTRIRERRKDAETLIARLSVRHEDIAATLDLALEIISDDLHQLYRRAEDSIRRLINQAIFKALYVCDEAITEAELAEPFAALRTLHDAIRALPNSAGTLAGRRQRRQRCPAKTKGPDPYRGREPFRVGSISEHLVRMRGLEPPPSYLDTDLNRARLPIPPHPRDHERRYRTVHHPRWSLPVAVALRLALLASELAVRAGRHRLGD